MRRGVAISSHGNDGARNGLGVLTLVGVIVVCGIAGIVVAEIYKEPTDVIERILLPTIAGLIGVLGGLFVNGNSR